MASPIIIPIVIVAAAGLAGYLIYRFVIYDAMCSRSIERTLQKYKIKKTQFQIVKEYYDDKGEAISDREIRALVKHYRQNEPDQFLVMYDAVRGREG